MPLIKNKCVECFKPLNEGYICDRCQCEISGDFDESPIGAGFAHKDVKHKRLIGKDKNKA